MTGTELMEVVQGGVSKKRLWHFYPATSAALKGRGATDQVPLNSDLALLLLGILERVLRTYQGTPT